MQMTVPFLYLLIIRKNFRKMICSRPRACSKLLFITHFICMCNVETDLTDTGWTIFNMYVYVYLATYFLPLPVLCLILAKMKLHRYSFQSIYSIHRFFRVRIIFGNVHFCVFSPDSLHTQQGHPAGRYNASSLAQGSIFPLKMLIQPTTQRLTLRNRQ